MTFAPTDCPRRTSITSETAQRIGQVLTNNLVAWKLVKQGVQDFFLQTRVNFDAALQRYHTALDLDPDYLEKLEAMPGIGRYVDPYPLAWAHLALGDRPAALAKLKQACQDRSEWVVFADEPGGLRTDPKLDELRDEPEFQELLKLAGLDVWPK